jgi:hypothetical protein
MKSEKNFKISLTENDRKGRLMLAQQSETSYEKAMAQIQLIKASSKVGQSSKKHR